MAITLLHGCCQIETSTRDLDETRRFMLDVLGAGLAEQELAAEIAQIIPDAGYDVDHLECGEAIFQVNQPSPTMLYQGRPSIHQAYLESVGPSVTNLNFYVDDHVHARDLLTKMGAATHIEGPSSAARSLADYGVDNTRPGADERPFLFMGSRNLIGFDLEIMEPNFLHFTRQSVQHPAYVQPRPARGDGNLWLERLIIAVERLQDTLENLERLFSPACRSRPFGLREGEWGQAFRIALGGVEIEYCQPRTKAGSVFECLDMYGPGVLALEFSANDPARVMSRCDRWGLSTDQGFDFLGDESCPTSHLIRCRELTGFDILLN